MCVCVGGGGGRGREALLGVQGSDKSVDPLSVSVYPFMRRFVSPSLCLCPCLSLSVCLPACLPVCLSVSLSVSMRICFYMSAAISPPILSISLSVPVCLSLSLCGCSVWNNVCA